jgi:hypothetical protein
LIRRLVVCIWQEVGVRIVPREEGRVGAKGSVTNNEAVGATYLMATNAVDGLTVEVESGQGCDNVTKVAVHDRVDVPYFRVIGTPCIECTEGLGEHYLNRQRFLGKQYRGNLLLFSAKYTGNRGGVVGTGRKYCSRNATSEILKLSCQ